MVNGIDRCLLQIAQISHDAWCCFDTSPNVSTFPAPWEASPLVVESQWVRNWGRSPCTVKLSTKHRGEKNNTWQPREKKRLRHPKKWLRIRKTTMILIHQCQIWENTAIRNILKFQWIATLHPDKMTHWFYLTLWILFKMAPKTTEDDSNLGTAVNTSKTHQTRVT